ncbi:DUF3341 domain-containing protein [Microvirga puerhi]|uniref:DUF3341 domain-containing protein n=1 Tax=Microvirga puerhi TaxID=2876078 RepID=A0ABS7VKP4_9HYPH|nr:DUF3341 domain-containing protein [Microvirga puerhi]MBZ6075700.1 DUF3341 domain-containing protein [Microvirga puerhi]
MRKKKGGVMREPAPHEPIFGILAEFSHPDALRDAVRKTYAGGYTHIDTYTPFPIEGLAEALHFQDSRVPLLCLAGGITGALTGYGMQVYTNLDFPIDIGGRPLISWQAFMLITFELTVLFAVLFAIAGMLLFNRLPRLNYPVFDIESFHLASSDKFFLIVFSNDPRFDPEETSSFLSDLDPVRVDQVGKAEEAE